MNLTVTSNKDGAWLCWGRTKVRAAIGSNGIGHKACEGDGITPRGVFEVRRIFYRADRVAKPRTSLPLCAIQKDDGWCDAPNDPNYNCLVKLPYPASTEHMWRQDHLYDIIAVLGFNDDPVIPGKGSAIFMHVARADYAPTQGCVALAYADVLAAIAQLERGDQIVID